METKIPKIIHYCWFGGGTMPEALVNIMKSWEVLRENGYEIIEWNESNCSFDENDFVRRAYAEKRWGFIGDYYRAKAVYDMGGIYLDTDVVVKRPFDDLLDNDAFIGFYNDYAMCTAIVGAKKGSEFIKGIMDMYDNNAFISKETVVDGETPRNPYNDAVWFPSNEYWSWYVIDKYPEFKMNGKEQHFSDVTICSKSYFEMGSIFGRFYTRHINYNSWRDTKKHVNPIIRFKRLLEKNEKCWIAIRHFKGWATRKGSSFYEYKKNKR